MSVDYIWHDHPLQIRSIVNAGSCFICSEPVNAYNYRCDSPDCDFFLHISCICLPLESLHPLHRNHPLSLRITGSGDETLTCNHCKLPCSRMAYRCSPCDFSLHLPCASSRDAFNLKIHRHPLSCLTSPPNSSPSFLCKICGKYGYGFNLGCLLGCDFFVHVECAYLPVTVTTDRHRHPLSITPVSAVDDGSGEFYCDIVCERSVNPRTFVYFCGELECQYMAHLGCLTSVTEPHIKLCYKEAEPRKETKSEYYIAKNFNTSVSKWGRPLIGFNDKEMLTAMSLIKIPTEDANGEVEINHFCHEHPLILSYNKHDREKSTCFGCFERMKSSIAYTCSSHSKCYFKGLHKWCGELPTQIRHPLHPEHPLSLLKRAPHSVEYCVACQDLLFSNTFVYNCNFCNQNIHAMCASIPSELKSEVHDHPLHLFQTTPAYPIKCTVCGFDSEYTHFVCEPCEFVADFKCAMLPRKVTNDCHVHTLILTNVQVQEDETEFICDACEKTRNGFSWVYHCAGCEFSSHTECALYHRRPNDFNLHEHVLSVINDSSSYSFSASCSS